ncbi:Putative serine/threonine-protein kinase VPS15 [Fusarium oxysporum f. sp. cubense race 1]|uniref:non-specific serine/threonine protein kinase n=1 Tax=Fusarium oxysporum f. sp. cubense (strain race 1) TaxID=1229664 RepID=N4UR32_FUSC1|nr:Putative serine/threonine-protein kinase VPS15 [Fusarium oxysporum f. sp. cubense race 1]
MGQGFSLATPSVGSAGIDISELSDVHFEKSIGNARFMKSIRGRHENGLVLVKVLVKPYADVKLQQYKKQIIEQSNAIDKIPNTLGFQRIIETETNGYLVRQFLYSSLYDRVSTRPFLEDIEKKWLAFQLLCALRDCHARDVYHGDIKAQNVLVTSWNWLYLSDFSSAYKPVMLPDDNPADFSYFFDTSGLRTCYVAPERFYASGEAPPKKAKMTWAMDIFSAGCVIAQLFLESDIFSLAQLYKYRRGEYDPVITHLSTIANKDLADMIAHMIQLDPEKRYSADQYLEFWKGKVFPHYFYNFLHQYMELITDPSSGNSPMSGTSKNLGEADDRIDRVFYDFDKISYFLGYQLEKRTSDELQPPPRLSLSHFPVRLNIPNHSHTVSSELEPPEDDGTLIFLTLIVSQLRNTARASSRIRACDVLLAFSERLTDEAKLDRVLPYLMTLLVPDETDLVLIAAIRTITQLLQLVQTVNAFNSHVLVDLATTAQRFLNMASSLRADGSMPITDPEVEPGADAKANFESVFDNAGRQLFEALESHSKQLVEDPDISVRRAFLASVPELCLFFDHHSNDVLLTHLNTYLNDRDWTLKCAFFDTIVGIAAFIGSTSLEEFMLPLMMQALADPEEYVVQAALHSLAQLAGLGLLSRPKVWELVDLISRFTMHPNIWIRESAAEFLSMSARYLPPADIRCNLMPLVKPFLKVEVLSDFSELNILDALKRPLARNVFDQAITWASKTERGIYWKPLQQLKPLLFGSKGSTSSRTSRDLMQSSMGRVARNDEDEQWLTKLRNLGLKHEDELKLDALHGTTSNGVVSLKSLGVTPQTVFFNDAPLRDPNAVVDLEPPAEPYTIADALLDASMTIDDSTGGKKRVNTNRRVQSVGPRSSRRLLSPTSAGRTHTRAPSAGQVMQTTDDGPSQGEPSSRNAVRHQVSALSLLDRKDKNKSIAQTGTTDANAFGEVEGPFAQTSTDQQASSEGNEGDTTGSRVSKHSYAGNDPSIQRIGVVRYGKLRVLREYQLPDGEFAVWCEHFRQESNSILVIATNRSRILGIDLRTMSLLYTLENPVHHGTPTCFCVDRKRNWLCVGTSHGVVDLWDLRFKMRLKGWGLPGKGSIYRICIHPTKGRGKWVCISGGTGQGEVTVWDLEKTVCREIYRAGGSKDGLKGYEPWDVDEDKREGMLGRYATNIEPNEIANADRGVRAMVVGTATAEDSRDVRHAFIVTGGSDKRLRFWDLSRMESSFIYSGLSPDLPKPTYTTSHPTTALTLNTERFPRQAPTAPNAGSGSRAKSSTARPPRSTVISLQQQQLLQSHVDSILDVALLEFPYIMSVSVDRMGVVFVFQ